MIPNMPTFEQLEVERVRLIALIAAARLELAAVKSAMRLPGVFVKYNDTPEAPK